MSKTRDASRRPEGTARSSRTCWGCLPAPAAGAFGRAAAGALVRRAASIRVGRRSRGRDRLVVRAGCLQNVRLDLSLFDVERLSRVAETQAPMRHDLAEDRTCIVRAIQVSGTPGRTRASVAFGCFARASRARSIPAASEIDRIQARRMTARAGDYTLSRGTSSIGGS
jgi:hypothetical protein